MAATWKTDLLFISSTFRDMHAERNQLNNIVFPDNLHVRGDGSSDRLHSEEPIGMCKMRS